MVANPATFDGGGEPTPSEAVVTVGWGGINRIDLEPAACADPECDADHGYTGVLASDDFSLRLSSAADGQDAVDALLDVRRDALRPHPGLRRGRGRRSSPGSSSPTTPAARSATCCPPWRSASACRWVPRERAGAAARLRRTS